MSAPSRPTLTERRADELRMTIALAARELFLADGSTSATVERICEKVGIAPRTFHRHFPVKEDVVMPLFREFAEQWNTEMSPQWRHSHRKAVRELGWQPRDVHESIREAVAFFAGRRPGGADGP